MVIDKRVKVFGLKVLGRGGFLRNASLFWVFLTRELFSARIEVADGP